MKKRILSIILVMALMLTLTPMNVFAAGVPQITIDSTTSTQDNTTWAWDAGTSTLTLKGINMSLSSDSDNYGIEITGIGDNALTTVNVVVIGENVISGKTGIVYRGSSATTNTINFSGTGSLTVSSGEIHSMSLWRTTVNFNSGLYNLSSSSTSNNNNFIISAMQTTCNFNGATVNMIAAPFGSGYVDGYYNGDTNSNVYINSGSVTINTRGTNITTSKVVINGGTSDFHIGTSTLNNINDYGKTTINGGQVKLTGGLGAEQFQNNALDTLALTTLTLDGISAATAVSSLTTTSDLGYTYGTTDMKTDANGKIYAYLPTGKTAATVVAGDNAYTGGITSNAGTLNLVSSLTDISLAPVPITYVKRATAGTKVAALTATGTPTSGITYSLAGSGANDSLFQIVGTQLQIKSGASLTAQSYTVKVKVTDGTPTNTYTKLITFTANVLPQTYVVSPAYNFTNASGVIATATFLGTPYGAGYAVGSTATITITLSGTATATGTHKIGLTSTKAGIITAPTTVTKTVTAGATPTDVFLFTFTMPAYTVDDLVVTNTFTPASEIPVTSITGAPTVGVAGTEINLNSATVSPSDATNKTIAWSVKNAGTTGVTTSDLASGKFTPGTAGTLVLTATIVNGATASTNYTQDITITVSTADTKIYTISADTSLFDFGSLTTGYGAAPASQTVMIRNTGNQSITLSEPAVTNASSNYNIGSLSHVILDAGDTATFTLQPKTGLAGGAYNETVRIAGTDSAAVSISVKFSVTAASSSGNGNSHGSVGVKATPDPSVTPIKINGQSENAGTTENAKEGNQTVTTVTVDDAKLQEKINAEGKKSTVSIPIAGSADIGQGILNGQTIKDMEKKESVLEIKTATATYTLPAAEVNIDSVSSQLGQTVELKDIQVSVRIAEPSDAAAKVVRDTADKNHYQIVVKPVEFEINCTSGSKTVSVSRFNGYVERTVAIPSGIEASKITTGIVLNADGTFSHVPTQIVKVDGKYYAKINSLTNSTYSVIYNPVEFADVASHWAKDSVNEMGSRLVISGIGENKFEPNRDITRAEFAAIIVRALGLTPDATKNTFSDVADSKWYSGYVGTAASYGIISGYNTDTFAPNAKITREQAMAMVARAMKITDLDAASAGGASTPLIGYTDAGKISGYAEAGILACLNTGVVTGKTSDTLAPKANITRAEVAVIIERLLQKSELI